MSIAITGIEKIHATAAKIEKLKRAFGEEFLKRVEEKTPVDTGRLKASWTLKINDKTIQVTNKAINAEGVPYAIFVEFGTIHTRPVLMLNRTIAESTDIMRTAKAKVGL
jgi:HK97 gp10 family phage protein